MQVGERWKGRVFTATRHKRKRARLAFWSAPSLRPPLFISGNNTQRKCAESPLAFQGGGSWTGEGAALNQMRVPELIWRFRFFFSHTSWNDDASCSLKTQRFPLSAWPSRRSSHTPCLHKHRDHCSGERTAHENATDGFVGRSRRLRSPTGA